MVCHPGLLNIYLVNKHPDIQYFPKYDRISGWSGGEVFEYMVGYPGLLNIYLVNKQKDIRYFPKVDRISGKSEGKISH